MTRPRPSQWLVAGTTSAVRTGKDLSGVGQAIAAAGFTHVAVADADPGTIPAASAALGHGVPGVVIFVSPVVSWPLGNPPTPTAAYPPRQVGQAVEDVLAALGREDADVVLAHKWDPAWRGGDEAVFEHESPGRALGAQHA